jgi:hypothetical protein
MTGITRGEDEAGRTDADVENSHTDGRTVLANDHAGGQTRTADLAGSRADIISAG